MKKYNKLDNKRYEGIQSLDIRSIQFANSFLFESSSCKKMFLSLKANFSKVLYTFLIKARIKQYSNIE